MLKRETRMIFLAVVAISVVANVVVGILRAGPESLTFANENSALFDEGLVTEVYNRVSPAVIEVHSDQKSGTSFSEYASGSGFLIDQEGYIVTSNHVIQGADRVRVSISERQDAVAEVRAIDVTNDLALLKVGPHQVSHIEPIELGDATTVQPGQMVIVIGSPFGLNNSVSVGVSSGVNRVLPGHAGSAISGMLQTDALIAPGNSGGPMLNSSGQAIGITTAMELTSGETTRSIGFAVPSNRILRLMAQLDTQG